MDKSGKWSIVLIVVVAAGFGVWRLTTKDRAQKQLEQDARQFAQQAQVLMQRQMAGEDVTDEQMKMFDEFLAKAEKAGDVIGGRDAKGLKAIIVSLRDLTPVAKRYDAAVKAIEAAGWINPAGFKKPEDIDARIKLVDEVNAANEGMDQLFATMPAKINSNLLAAGFSQGEAGKASSDMTAGAGFDVLRQIRQCDREMMTAARGQLLMMREEWGKWKLLDGGVIDFGADPLNAKYNQFQDQVDAAATRQGELQQQHLLNQQRRLSQ